MKKLVFFIISLAVIFLNVSSAYATCYPRTVTPGMTTVSPITQTVYLSPVVVQKDMPVGTIIAQARTYNNSSFYVDCYGGGQVYFTMSYGSGIKSGIDHVYKTNVPGVGIMASYSTGYFDNPRYTVVAPWNGGYMSTMTIITVSLFVTGPVTPGVLKMGEIGYVTTDGDGVTKANTLILGSSTTITPSSCAIQTSNINIKLDDVSDAELVSVGTTAKLKNFDIGLDCEANARVNVKLTGTQNPDTTAAGVLKLTNAGSAGVAKGVGIQMLYDNKPMTVNQSVLLKTSAGGLETFTFGAQYYQTKAAVSGGSANATATLDITYQ